MKNQKPLEQEVPKEYYKDCLRVLKILYGDPLYFTQMQELLGIDLDRLDRVLEILRKIFLVISRVVPAKGKFLVQYELTKRGRWAGLNAIEQEKGK